ncbi:MAG TPA: TonB-dependent receptor [Phnomibacter sp.]|nr:TonB-dependent receptor [Phnomibacter sp.]
MSMKKLPASSMLVFLLLLLGSSAWSQGGEFGTVKGIVRDEKGKPLAGVSVVATDDKAKFKTGTQSDTAGYFTFSRLPAGNTYKFTFTSIGFQAEVMNGYSVKAGSTTSLVAKLTSGTATDLDEVVVVGYGTARKKDLTSSVSTVDGKEIEKMPVTNIAEAITGRMPGVQVTSTEGSPGGDIVIRVRGGGSVTQDNSPLYVVDGFPVDNINNIAPTDIENFTVLKDASAAAIYGSRGANGVVLITTKGAKGGKTNVSYSGYVQIRQLPKKMEVLSPYEFVLAQYEYARTRSQSEVDNFQKYFGVYGDLELYKSQEPIDWQQDLFGNGGLSQQQNINITGGNDRTKMSFGTTYNNEQGIMPGSSYKRLYSNFKLNHALYDNLKLDFNVRYSNAETMGAGTSGGSSVRVGDGITARPVNGLSDFIVDDPSIVDPADDQYDVFANSLIGPKKVIEQDYRRRLARTITSNVALNWNIIKPLTFRTEFSVDFINNENRRYYGPLTGESRNVGENKPIGVLDLESTRRSRFANTLTYMMPRKNGHDFTVMGGQELLTGNYKTVGNRAKLFDADIEPERLFSNMTLGTAEYINTAAGPTEHLLSFFGRANYSFRGKYLLSASFRADGSSKFVAPNQWGYFPAGSAAWVVSEEEFLKGNKTLPFLKLRLGYGEAGNNRINSSAARRTFSPSSNRSIGFGEAPQPYWVSSSSVLPNPNIKWETTITRSAAIDFGLFNNKLTGTVEVYKNTTKDLLVEGLIPPYLGYTSQIINIGQTSNQGVEFSLNAPIVNKKDFTLSSFFNISFNQSSIDKLDGKTEMAINSNWAGTDLRYIDDYRVYVGQEVGLMYGFVTKGFYTTADFERYDAVAKKYILNSGVADASTVLGNGVKPGSLKLADLDGDGVITTSDRKVIGHAQPKFFGGFGLNSTYKGFDFAAVFNYTYGSDVYNTGRIGFNMLYRTSYGNMLNTMNSDNRYTYIDNSGNLVTSLEELEKMNANAKIWSPFSMGTASPVFHSYAVEDASFLRLSNLTLGYSLPKRVISHIGMSKLRAFVTVYNAWLLTNYSGYDPEVSATRSSGYSQLTPNVDYSAYPKSRTFTFGLNVSF